jgi:hypothetical protein
VVTLSMNHNKGKVFGLKKKKKKKKTVGWVVPGWNSECGFTWEKMRKERKGKGPLRFQFRFQGTCHVKASHHWFLEYRSGFWVLS